MTLLIAIILLAVFAYLAAKRLDLALAAVVLLLPTYLIRFNIGPVPMTFLEGMILVLFVVWLIKKTRAKAKNPSKDIIFWSAVGAFILAATLAIIWSPDKTAALGAWKAYFIEPVLFLVVLADLVRKKKEKTLLLIKALGASAIAIAAWGLLQRVFGFGFVAPWDGAIEAVRITSVFEYPNALALFLGPIVGLFLALLLGRLGGDAPGDDGRPGQVINLSLRAANPWWFSLIVVGLGAVAIYLAKSQGAYLGLLAGVVFVGLLSVWRKWLVIGLVFLAVAVLLIPSWREASSAIITGRDASTDVRLVMWQGTANLIRDHWITGAGLAGFPEVYDQYRLPQHTELLLYPHNIVLNFWVETGLLGLAAFAAIVVIALRRSFRALFRQKSVLVFGLWTALVVLLIHGIIDVPYFKNDLAVEFWLIIGLLLASGRLVEQDSVEPS